jgi:beta-galactosidase
VAYDQIVLREEAPVAHAVPEGLACRNGNTFSGTFTYPGTLSPRTATWEAVFDPSTGALASYKIDGVEHLSEPLLPCFDRAQTENDLGAALHLELAAWRNPALRPDKVEVREEGGHYVLESRFAPIAGAAQVVVRYDIFADGSLSVTESMMDAGGLSKLPPLFRFGMAFAMPGRFSELDFFGLGPWENYPDRQSSALLGHYRQHVNEQYNYGYVRTQESGNHGGLRWLRVLDEAGNGLEVTAVKRFAGSVLPFSLRDLDVIYHDQDPAHKNHNNQFGAARHSLELKGKACEDQRSLGTTYVHIDQSQMGVGGINSWGQWPLEQYRIPAAPRCFRFYLRPVKN